MFRKGVCALTSCLAWGGKRRSAVLCFFSCLLVFIFFHFWIYFGLAQSRVPNWWRVTELIQYLLLSTCLCHVIYVIIIRYFFNIVCFKRLQRMFDMDKFQILNFIYNFMIKNKCLIVIKLNYDNVVIHSFCLLYFFFFKKVLGKWLVDA